MDVQTYNVRIRRGQWIGTAKVSCDNFIHQAGKGVLVIDDGDVHERPNAVDAALDGYEIIEASPDAARALLAAGYRLKGLVKA